MRIRFSVVNSLFEDVFAQFENAEGGQEDTDDDASPHVRFNSTDWGLELGSQSAGDIGCKPTFH